MVLQFPDSFLFYHPGALGDNVLTWPIIAAMKQSYPEYHFIGLGNPEILKLAQHLGLLNNKIDHESPDLLSFWTGKSLPGILSPVKGAIIWLNDPDPSICLLKKVCSLPVIQISQKSNRTLPMTQFYWEQISQHYTIPHPDYIEIHLPGSDLSPRYIFIHPGSGSPAKNYPVSFYRQIALEISRYTQHKIAFILGPTEQEREIENEIMDFPSFKPLNITMLSNLLQQAVLFIGNDSGVSHLAGFLGVPTLAFYKTTNPKIWGVKGKQTTNILAEDPKKAFIELLFWLNKNSTRVDLTL